MKRIALILMMGLAAQANAALLAITYDVNITSIGGLDVNINTNYTLSTDTANFYFLTDTNSYNPGVGYGSWNFGSLQDEFENLRAGIPYDQFADTYAVQYSDQPSNNFFRTQSYNDQSLFSPNSSELHSQVELMELVILTPGLAPAINNVNDFTLLLSTMKEQNIQGNLYHDFISKTESGCTLNVDNTYSCQNLIEESSVSYLGGAKISSVKLNGVEVSNVPVPASFWLMGSGLASLAVAARRKKA